MNMPGFAAEAALYKTSEVYERRMARISSVDGQEVTPQGLHYPDLRGYHCEYGDCHVTNYDPVNGKLILERDRCCSWYGWSLVCKPVSC